MANAPASNRSKRLLVFLGIFALLGIYMAIAKPEIASGASIQSSAPVASPMDKAIEKVRKIGGVESATVTTTNGKLMLSITIEQKAVWSGSSFVLTTAGTIQKCFEQIAKADQLASINTVLVTLQAPLVDKFGNETQCPVLRYTFRGFDLARINWDEMVQQRLLEFADPEWLHLEGARMAKEYALKGNHAEEAPSFCRIAIYGRQ